MWKEVIPIMQNWTGCADLGMEETITMKDDRDYPNNLYTVAKLKDGKCWMTQNLMVGKNSPMTLTSNDSNTSTNIQLPATTSVATCGMGLFLDKTHGGYYQWSSNATYVCPKSWRLPSVAEYTNLAAAYNNNRSNEMLDRPLNFDPYMGCICCGGDFTYGSATASLYLTKDGSTNDNNNAFRIQSYGGMGFQGSSNTNGNPVRCILSI